MKRRKKIKSGFVEKLEDVVGNDWVVTRREAMLDYLTDETAPTVCPKPAADVILVRPSTTQEISSILKLANDWKVPVFPRGGGTGVVGGSIPTESGIVLSLERMNRVIEVDRENPIMVEVGVKLEMSLKAWMKLTSYFLQI